MAKKPTKSDFTDFNERVRQAREYIARSAEKRQKLNDHAYFLLCWGRLEAHLDEACRDAIRKRWKNPDWTKRRGWDLYNPEDKRISGLKFDERISLVLDRQIAEWGMTMKWYSLRNFIAHGGSHDERIDLAFAVNEFHQIQSCVDT